MPNKAWKKAVEEYLRGKKKAFSDGCQYENYCKEIRVQTTLVTPKLQILSIKRRESYCQTVLKVF